MDDVKRKKRGFLAGLFRSGSRAAERPAPGEDVHKPASRNDGGQRRRPRRRPPRDAKGKGKEIASAATYEPGPLSEWPPEGVARSEELKIGDAMRLVSQGVPAHKGHKRAIPHASEIYHALYTTTAGNHGGETDGANLHDSMIQLTTLRGQGSGPPDYPWETLEQPSCAFRFGRQPGTITLNHWAALSAPMPPPIALRDAGVTPREASLSQIFERLKELERGLDMENPERMYGLYQSFLHDTDRASGPGKAVDRQIMDLIMALSGAQWVDFTIPKNQIVTTFIFDVEEDMQEQYHSFFYQLLLSLELELRISSRMHDDTAKMRLMGQIPPKIQWNLALARRWKENVRIKEWGDRPEDVGLRFMLRKRQAKMLKRFAQMMKWPNLTNTLAALTRTEADGALFSISSHAMAFFSGLVLPGPTFPFLIMNALVDIDPDRATDNLALLTHLYPECGFQYGNSYTYWSSTSIVGKVLAPTCHEVAGWVGPARPTADLSRSEIARIRSKKPPQGITVEDVTSMSERSDPLGPPAEVYPVNDYELVAPDTDDMVDTVRVELLSLRLVTERRDKRPGWFDATVKFAIDGRSWPLRLSYDVLFISSWPCSQGPHPLFFDYAYTVVKADEVVQVRDWGKHQSNVAGSKPSTPVGGLNPQHDNDDEERVLVIESFGVPDNEVLARAWCANSGLSALVTDIGKTCMACAIREAYAATLNVVILIDDQSESELE